MSRLEKVHEFIGRWTEIDAERKVQPEITNKLKNEHSKIIFKVAKQKLKPFGVVQLGKSRIWLDDRGWYTTQIEFQPSSWARGTYLNIGVDFHWYKKQYMSFNLEGRQENFVEYKNDEQFTAEMEKFCDLIIKKILEIRENLRTIASAKKIILKHNFQNDDLWGNYHKGTICGLAGDFDKMNKYFNDLLKVENDMQLQWIEDLKENVKHLQSKTYDLELFKAEKLNIISETRKLKKLPEMEINL